MGCKKDISDFIHGKIVSYNEMGLNQSEIARRLNISRRSVKRYIEDGRQQKHSNSGRKRCTTERGDRLIKHLVTNSPTKSSANISAVARDSFNISISP